MKNNINNFVYKGIQLFRIQRYTILKNDTK